MSPPPDDPISRLETPLFEATLHPHRSLSRNGLAWVMGFVGLVGLAVSIPFLILGAWPIAGFMGLDVALIYAAFRYHNATARSYEQIVLSQIELLFRSVSWRGVVRPGSDAWSTTSTCATWSGPEASASCTRGE